MKERIFKKAVKFVNFSFVGTTTFAMQLFFTVLLTETMLLTYYVSHAISLAIAWTINFIFNMKYTFHVKGNLRGRMERFALVAVASSVFNWIFVVASVEFFSMHYFIAIILVSIVLSAVIFATEEMWVFSRARLAKHYARKAPAER
ncbi:GtrA family protein [Candidatus Woesearchaeota archaeon]|nr:GtrA family protein [Candidatus Woesearchaeota archaeon]